MVDTDSRKFVIIDFDVNDNKMLNDTWALILCSTKYKSKYWKYWQTSEFEISDYDKCKL